MNSEACQAQIVFTYQECKPVWMRHITGDSNDSSAPKILFIGHMQSRKTICGSLCVWIVYIHDPVFAGYRTGCPRRSENLVPGHYP